MWKLTFNINDVVTTYKFKTLNECLQRIYEYRYVLLFRIAKDYYICELNTNDYIEIRK